MQFISNTLKYRFDVITWRRSLSLPAKLAAVCALAGLTGALAQVRIPLPFTPVPITGQVLPVLLAGVIMGRWWGGASMALYAGLGIAGIPWFTGFSSGLGATGGYILGFIPAAAFLGHFAGRYVATHRMVPMIGLMLAATLLYYIPGMIWLGLWLKSAGASVSFTGLVNMGVTPFIVGDIIKAVLAGAIAFTIIPKSDNLVTGN